METRKTAKCTGCGCTDDQACQGGCWWLRVDYEAGHGICSNCCEHDGALNETCSQAPLIKQTTITIRAGILKGLHELAAKNSYREYLNGILVDIRANETRLIASDGVNIGIYRINGNKSVFGDPVKAVIPDVLLDRISVEDVTFSGAGFCSEDITVTIFHDDKKSPKRIGLKINPIDLTMAAPEPDGKYPDYESILPDSVSGGPGLFDFDRLAAFNRARDFICPAGITYPHLHYNGPESVALVTILDTNFIGAIMPIRDKQHHIDMWWLDDRHGIAGESAL